MKREEIVAAVAAAAAGIESEAGGPADIAARQAIVALGTDVLVNIGRIADSMEVLAEAQRSIAMHGNS